MLSSSIVVVGGAVVDLKFALHEAAVMHTSNPGRMTTSFGGVGRNVAENLARLGVGVTFLGAVGSDALGDRLISETSNAGVDMRHVLRSDTPTGTYTAILDPRGELVLAVVAMDIAGELSPAFLRERRAVLEGASFVVGDGNSREDTLGALVEFAGPARVVLDPVSVPKAAKLRGVLGRAPIYLVTPNRDELAVLVGSKTSPQEGAAALHDLGVENVWVRLGARGSLLSRRGQVVHLPALPARVVDVTGAGDACLAGCLFALSRGEDLETAARFGHAAAALTLESPLTVSPHLTPGALSARLEGVS